MQNEVVFPPMDEATFAAKHAKWLARTPKTSQPKNSYGRPVSHQIPKEQFTAWIVAQQSGRAAHRKKTPHLPMRKDIL